MSHWIMGMLAGLFALIGLLMAGAAVDAGIFIFGLLLFVGGVLFIFLMIKTAFDEKERA
jgi:hypothetical protein